MTEAENLINSLRQTSAPITSRLVERVVAELGRLQAEVVHRREISCDYHELVLDLRAALADKSAQFRRQACVLLQIREACALPDVPLAELPEAVEQLLSELADRQIRRDIEPQEFQAGCDEFVVHGLDTVPGHLAGDPEDDEW